MRNPSKKSILAHWLKKAQYEQQEELHERLSETGRIGLVTSIVRKTDGAGEHNLLEVLRQNEARPEIVMLIAGATDGMTYLQQAAPKVFKAWAGSDTNENKLMAKVMDEAVKSGMSGMAEGLFKKVRDDANEALSRPMDKIKMVDYMTRRSEEVRQRVFGDVFCELIVVRNASRQDVIDVSKVGGQHRAAIMHSHGTTHSLSMTDGMVRGDDLAKPEVKLRALVLDACGTGGEMIPSEERIGHNMAEDIYGFNVSATPRDTFGRDLQKR